MQHFSLRANGYAELAVSSPAVAERIACTHDIYPWSETEWPWWILGW